MGRVHVEEEALISLKNSFANAGENYKVNYNRLTSLINEITENHIQGDPAEALLRKYEEKKEAFEKVYEIINKTQNYTNSRTEQFVSDMETLINKQII